MNDLEKSMAYMKPIMFADDTTAHAESSSLPDLLSNVNIETKFFIKMVTYKYTVAECIQNQTYDI